MRNLHDLPRVRLGVFPTPFYRLDRLSEQYGRGIWIKRDDLCGVALGGSKVRKLEFVLAEALDQGCDTVFTTGGAQSNHAALTAACAARLGMKCILLLKRRGVTEHRGNLVLDELFGAEVRLLDMDSYDEIYAEMHRIGGTLEQAGHKCCYIPVGASTALGAVGYVSGAREIAVQAMAAGVRLGTQSSPPLAPAARPPAACWEPGRVSARCEGHRHRRGQQSLRQDRPPAWQGEAAALLECPFQPEENAFQMVEHMGPGYALPNPEDTPYIEELARTEGILLDPVYTGKAFAGMMQLLRQGALTGRTTCCLSTPAARRPCSPSICPGDRLFFPYPAGDRIRTL